MTIPSRPAATPVAKLDPDDPAHAIIAAFEATQKQSLAELSKLVTKLADDVTASSVLAEQAARAKAEGIITQAGEWTSGQIMAAGRLVSGNIASEREASIQHYNTAISTLWTHFVIAGACSGACIGGLVSLLFWWMR